MQPSTLQRHPFVFTKKHTAIIWDLDGTLYPITSAFQTARHEAAIKTILFYNQNYDRQQAEGIITKSKQANNAALIGFISQHAHDEADVYLTFQSHLEISSIPILSDSEKELLENLNYKQFLVTQNNLTWTQRVLKHIGLSDFFHSKSICTRGDFSGYHKSSNQEPYQLALEKFSLNASECIIIDDKSSNLKQAKNLGMLTILLDQKQIMNTQPCIDYQFSDKLALLKALSSL